MSIKFIDLFAGIGGFHLALDKLGANCVFASEINEHAIKTYLTNHSIPNFSGDITLIDPHEIPDHDILCGGFPCQPFSQAGYRKGFKDERGSLFSNIIKILKVKKPRAYFLENVRHLKKHDNGKTFATIRKEIENVGYNFFDYIVHAKDHGVPQLRPRLFMIGFRDQLDYTPPKKIPLKLTMSDIFGGNCEREIGFTLRVGGESSGINDRHNWDSYLVDGKVIKLTVAHAKKMQGFPDDFNFPVSRKEAMKQIGNSVAVPAIQDYAREIIKTISNHETK